MHPSCRLEFHDATSHKLWEVSVSDSNLQLAWGRVGTAGQRKVKELESPAAAQAAMDKLIAEKRRDGYADAKTVAATPAAKAAAAKPAAKPAATVITQVAPTAPAAAPAATCTLTAMPCINMATTWSLPNNSLIGVNGPTADRRILIIGLPKRKNEVFLGTEATVVWMSLVDGAATVRQIPNPALRRGSFSADGTVFGGANSLKGIAIETYRTTDLSLIWRHDLPSPSVPSQCAIGDGPTVYYSWTPGPAIQVAGAQATVTNGEIVKYENRSESIPPLLLCAVTGMGLTFRKNAVRAFRLSDGVTTWKSELVSAGLADATTKAKRLRGGPDGMSVSRDGRFASIGTDLTLSVFRMVDGARLAEVSLAGSKESFTMQEISSDGRFVVTWSEVTKKGGLDYVMTVFQAAGGHRLARVEVDLHTPDALLVGPNDIVCPNYVDVNRWQVQTTGLADPDQGVPLVQATAKPAKKAKATAPTALEIPEEVTDCYLHDDSWAATVAAAEVASLPPTVAAVLAAGTDEAWPWALLEPVLARLATELPQAWPDLALDVLDAAATDELSDQLDHDPWNQFAVIIGELLRGLSVNPSTNIKRMLSVLTRVFGALASCQEICLPDELPNTVAALVTRLPAKRIAILDAYEVMIKGEVENEDEGNDHFAELLRQRRTTPAGLKALQVAAGDHAVGKLAAVALG